VQLGLPLTRIASILLFVFSLSFSAPPALAADPWAEVLAKFAAAEAARLAAIEAATPEGIAAAALKAAISAADSKLLGQSPSLGFSKSIIGYNDCSSLGPLSLCPSGNAVQRSGVLSNTDLVKAVTFFERANGSTNLIFTAASHAFAVGCKVQITGLAIVNGIYQIREVTTNTFSVTSQETFGIYSTYLSSFNVFATPLSCIPTTSSDDLIYFPKNLNTASKTITAAAIIGNVNSTASTGNTPDPMRGVYVYAEIHGPGILTLCDYSNCSPSTNSNYSFGRATLIKLSHLNSTYQLLVGTDGTAGKATITISAANSISATPVVIATETVVFFDTPAKASLTQLAYSINGDAGAAATSVATLAVTDKDGNSIPYAHFSNLGYYATAASANTTVLPAQTALTSKTLSLQPKGALYGTSDVTVTVQNDAGATAASIVAATAVPTGFSDAAKLVPTVKFSTTAQSVIVAKNQIATLTVTPSDAGAFAPGAKGTLTFVAKDVNALAVPDSLTATVKSVSTVATSIATQNGSVITDFNSLATLGTWGLSSATGLDAAGTMTLTLYAPVVEGNFTLSMLLGGSAAVAGTASAGFASTMAGTTASLELTVTKSAATKAADAASEVAQAALDAAAEATDAANAATDAGNAAAEAADAATAAAQDAADAVAALSTQVSEMISALKKQITALTNLVIKIQKKA
jgi:hypothetical protein